MKIQELDLIEVVHQGKIGNKKKLQYKFLKRPKNRNIMSSIMFVCYFMDCSKIWSLMK